MKKTVIIGASPNTHRYAYEAALRLIDYGHEIVPLGIKIGKVAKHTILQIRNSPTIEDIHTVSLYIAPRHQPQYYDYLLGLKPKRIIFNPGTENSEFMNLCREGGIEVVEGCTLVMLGTGQY